MKKLSSKEEIRDLAISILIITLIFAYNPNNPSSMINLFPTFLFIVIIAFVFHELAHRFVARKFGAVAVYKMWIEGLLFGLIFMIVGFKFVAPGAVVIYPYRFKRWGMKFSHLTTNEMGIIAGVGPLVNLFFAIIFRFFSGEIFQFVSSVNAFLAFFNLLPIPPLDGSKVLIWKPAIWIFLFIISILLVLRIV